MPPEPYPVIFPRASGILLHPTSLPGPFGIGDLGPAAFAFADFLAGAGQTYWQMLPLGPTGYGDSPYQSFASWAGNTNLVSPARLRDDGLLTNDDLSAAPQLPDDRVNFGPVIKAKDALLRRALARFRAGDHPEIRVAFDGFCQQTVPWVDNYALFRALKDANHGAVWTKWDPQLVHRDPEALARAASDLRDEIEAHKFFQFLFFKQWFALRAHCRQLGLRLIGDIPIFVAHDSVDVWTNSGQFKLNPDGSARIVAGVPPDYFSATGQLWGNPMYDWERMRADGFHWWIARMRASLGLVDLVRLDHFRGFAACWEIPGGEATAVNGAWVPAPGRELFVALENALGTLPIIAEDLGVITPDVEALRDELGFPGMRILQFAFGSDPMNQDLPHNYVRNAAAYTGTHDNDTAVGWFRSESGAGSTRDEAQVTKEREFAMRYLDTDGAAINWDLIRAVWASVADTALTPMQDLLGCGNEARMNLPASESGNWSWRFREGELTPELSARLRELTVIYGRLRAGGESRGS